MLNEVNILFVLLSILCQYHQTWIVESIAQLKKIIQVQCEHVSSSVDGGKNTLQQRGSLPILEDPIRLMNVWCGRPDEIMDPLPF